MIQATICWENKVIRLMMQEVGAPESTYGTEDPWPATRGCIYVTDATNNKCQRPRGVHRSIEQPKYSASCTHTSSAIVQSNQHVDSF